MTNKYNVGDFVEFAGQKATITKVTEEDYFFGANSFYYLYDLEFTDGVMQKGVSEPAISLIRANAADVAKDIKRICECGSWAVHWGTEHHSRWCPAHGLYTLTRGEYEE